MYLEHVNLTVADLDRSIAFYCDLLDGHVRWKGEIGPERMGAHVGDDHCYVALFQASERGTRSAVAGYPRPGFNHFGFVVDDLDNVRARLARLGAPVEEVPDYPPGRRFYTFDPDGHEIELVEY